MPKHRLKASFSTGTLLTPLKIRQNFCEKSPCLTKNLPDPAVRLFSNKAYSLLPAAGVADAKYCHITSAPDRFPERR